MKFITQCLIGPAIGAFLMSTTSVVAADCPEGYPSKPINLIVGFGAGGGTDSIARGVASAVEEQQGWTFVVDNRPGAGGGVASTVVKSAAPDGYTIGAVGTDTIAIIPYTTPDAAFSYEDFDYIASAMQIQLALVTVADAPYDTLEEFIDFAKENGRATVSVAGVNQEIAIEEIAEHFGANIVAIAGQGAAEALASALGGHVHATTQGSQHVQQIAAGEMKQLASLTDTRAPYAPDSMTLLESGLDIDLQAHTMFMVPKGIDAAIKSCLEQAFDEATASESYAELMRNFDNTALNLGPERLYEIIERDANYYRERLATE